MRSALLNSLLWLGQQLANHANPLPGLSPFARYPGHDFYEPPPRTPGWDVPVHPRPAPGAAARYGPEFDADAASADALARRIRAHASPRLELAALRGPLPADVRLDILGRVHRGTVQETEARVRRHCAEAAQRLAHGPGAGAERRLHLPRPTAAGWLAAHPAFVREIELRCRRVARAAEPAGGPPPHELWDAATDMRVGVVHNAPVGYAVLTEAGISLGMLYIRERFPHGRQWMREYWERAQQQFHNVFPRGGQEQYFV